MHVVNLDPAADHFAYPVSADIRELISLEDVMEELNLGPNGALLYCMEYFEDSLDDWLSEALEGFGEDDCVIFDCPGQIELYSHHFAFRSFVDQMQVWGWRLVAVYMLDAQFITDGAKFIAGCMQCQAAMMNLELPHVNLMSKVDLVDEKGVLEPFSSQITTSSRENCMSACVRNSENSTSRLRDCWKIIAWLAFTRSTSATKTVSRMFCTLWTPPCSTARTPTFAPHEMSILEKGAAKPTRPASPNNDVR